MTPLRQRMLADLKLRNYAPGTQRLYLSRVARFAAHYGRCPSELGPEEAREYLHHLVETEQVSWSFFKQAVCALRFLYKVTLERPEMIPYLLTMAVLAGVVGRARAPGALGRPWRR